ncbi:hypothetical protein VKT23_016407 [Stygiomarasmius scandens]|uniref:Sulfhydryl oxidase n=1 Tax=Marasmiellus scandens TaxID=2682957 RepID=A0ABR1IUZ0_9AGAR
MPDLAPLLESPPSSHEATNACTLDSQRALATAWRVATVYLSWNADIDTSPETIRRVFEAFTQHIRCEECIRNRDRRIDQILRQWAELQPPRLNGH